MTHPCVGCAASPLKGATPAARQSRFRGVLAFHITSKCSVFLRHSMNNPTPEFAKQMANTIRMLAVDAVEKAKSGHPGAPMGMADIAEVLWNRHLTHNPANPHWHNRDRFVLSNGHGSMLLYALLHLTGYDLPMAELKNFRQLHSKTPGHPE